MKTIACVYTVQACQIMKTQTPQKKQSNPQNSAGIVCGLNIQSIDNPIPNILS